MPSVLVPHPLGERLANVASGRVRIVGVVKEALQALVQAAHNLSRTVADRDLLGRRVGRVGSGKDRVVRILRARTRTQESASKRVASLRNKRTS